jgi:hypothetical protein
MIKLAAIRQGNIVYVGRRHHDCIRWILACGLVQPPVNGEQGFVTDEGKFVDRREAFKIARECKQIIRKHGRPDELYSEDIY